MSTLEPLNNNPFEQEGDAQASPLIDEAPAVDAASVVSEALAPDEAPVFDDVPAAAEPDFAQDQPMAAEPELAQDQPATGLKKHMKWAIVALAVAVVALIVSQTNIFSHSPVKRFMNGAETSTRTLYDTMKEQVLTTGVTLEVDFSQARDLIEAITGMPVSLNADLALGFYANEYSFAMDLDSHYMNQRLLDALLVYNEKELAVASETLLSNNSYGVSFENFEERLKGSAFGPDQNTSMSLSWEAFDALVKYVSSRLEMAEKEQVFSDFMDRLADRLEASLEKYGKVTEGKEKITVAGKSINTSLVTLELDPKALRGIAEDMLRFLKDDKDFKDILAWYFEMNPYSSYSYMYLSEDTADMIASVYEELDDALEHLDSLEERLVRVNALLVVKGNLSGDNLVQLRGELEVDGEEFALQFTLGPDPSDPQECSFIFASPEVESVFRYLVSANDKSSYEATISVNNESSYEDVSGECAILWNKKSGDMLVTIDIEESYSYFEEYSYSQHAEFEANVTESGKKTILVPTRISVDYPENPEGGESIPLQGITLTIDCDAKIPATPQYTDILTMSEGELEALMQDLEKSLSQLYGIFGGF